MRIIIINWKFKEGHQKEFNVEDNGDLVICLNHASCYNFCNEIKKYEELNEELLILLHENTPNKDVTLHEIKEKFVNHIVESFKDADGAIYYKKKLEQLGFLPTSGLRINSNAIINGQVKKTHFNFVWESYCGPISIESQKRKIKELWLPLTIDIQGLSEVKEEKANDYFDQIKNEIIIDGNTKTDYCKSLETFHSEDNGPSWDKIRKQLSGDFRDIDPIDIVNALVNSSDFNSFKNMGEKYLDKQINNKINPNFLPNWLEEIAK
jgi:hypothetical protein